jgi:hypothetical protein
VFEDVGACSHSERRFSKPEHDIIATAATRAHNRATSDLVGMGEVTSDEMLEPELVELELPEWALAAETPALETMLGKLVDLVGEDRARVLMKAIGERYDGVPNVVTGVVNALHSMLAPKPASDEAEQTTTPTQES